MSGWVLLVLFLTVYNGRPSAVIDMPDKATCERVAAEILAAEKARDRSFAAVTYCLNRTPTP